MRTFAICNRPHFPILGLLFCYSPFSLADRVGFEPTCRSRDKSISSAPRYDRFDTCPHIYSLSVVPGKWRELQERTNKIIKLSNFQKPLFYRGLRAVLMVRTAQYFE